MTPPKFTQKTNKIYIYIYRFLRRDLVFLYRNLQSELANVGVDGGTNMYTFSRIFLRAQEFVFRDLPTLLPFTFEKKYIEMCVLKRTQQK